MGVTSAPASHATSEQRRSAQIVEITKARLRKLHCEEEQIRREHVAELTAVHRAKAELTALLGAAYVRRMKAGEDPAAIAHRALVSVNELWLLLSGSYEATASDWIRRLVAGFAATDAILSDYNDLREHLERLHNASVRSQNTARRWDEVRRCIDEAEARLEAAAVTLATLDVENERRQAQSRRLSAQPPLSPSDSGSRTSTTVTPDAHGHDHKPDPLSARSEAEFIALMRRFREWAGNPSYRSMADSVPNGPSYSTFATLTQRRTIPKKLRAVESFIRGAGGTEEDLQNWATAWRRFHTASNCEAQISPETHIRRPGQASTNPTQS